MDRWRTKARTVIAFGIWFLSCHGVSSSVAAPHGTPDEQVVQHMLRNTTGLTAAEIRHNYDQCDGTTLSMKICSAYRWSIQDLRLNRAFSLARAVSKDPDYRESLLRAQRSWLTYRDNQCDFEGIRGAPGGTAEGLYVLSCKEKLTKLQADMLEAGMNQN